MLRRLPSSTRCHTGSTSEAEEKRNVAVPMPRSMRASTTRPSTAVASDRRWVFSTGALPPLSMSMRTAAGDISNSSVISPSPGTKFCARAPVDQTTSTVRASRSAETGAVVTARATMSAGKASGAGLPPSGSIGSFSRAKQLVTPVPMKDAPREEDARYVGGDHIDDGNANRDDHTTDKAQLAPLGKEGAV